MLITRICAALVAALLVALPFSAPAQEPDRDPAVDRLVKKHSDFAGSDTNAKLLIEGLRNDSAVTLERRDGTKAPSFTPQTPKMGYGNVDIALSLAKAALANHGIDQPTPEQIAASLNGGTFTMNGKTITLTGILVQRESGMGWGQIAHAQGVKLGELMRNEKASREALDRKHAESKHDRGEFQRARVDRPERPHKFERPERPDRRPR